ncbi:hypothetical protein UFOVP1346_25 [uncultured Caudovirales phage]|uniref:Uncharacterized protein n=1 Tax=uncultured Caudovirales phage TaxID=2100421 RepID=A0A6J5QST5_9CAUD|nr:hypothetical protein UFOVP921_5 [uncultured Caudovirales phage]CAB4187633.1 hypothetical protein UFOVP1156_41 [uncultured Caudovirales phage]CAB4200132.1 hypothetical protein UFOVP1346_25 [uncultured Caudovirales phage]
MTSKAAAKRYTQAEVTQGLMAMVGWAGSASDAVKSLKVDGLEIPSSTLRSWTKETHRDEYEELRGKYAGQMEDLLVKNYREMALRSSAVQMKAIEAAERRLDLGADTDPARTAAALSKVSQVSTDKLMSLTGRPTVITETRGMNEILRSLASKVPGLVVFEGEADEL